MSRGLRLLVPIGLVAIGAVIVTLAPAERTLGEGIRWVYVHVALVWAGTLALAVAGVTGLALLFSRRTTIADWIEPIWRAGLLAFALGIVFSMIAARVNWGAVLLAEPRMVASIRFLAIAVILQAIATLVARPRVTALLAVVTFVLLLIDVGGAQLVMHPRDPVRTATSSAIQLTFASLFAVATALTAWTARVLKPRGALAP
jgi:hypothetical protein